MFAIAWLMAEKVAKAQGIGALSGGAPLHRRLAPSLLGRIRVTLTRSSTRPGGVE